MRRGRGFFREALRAWLALASLHSLVLGLAVYFLAEPLLAFLGFDPSGGLFYPRQSGVFLVVLGVGYGLAAADPQKQWGLVLLTILSKAAAVLFLFSEALLLGAPPSVLAAGGGDAVLGGVATFLAIRSRREGEGTL